MTSDINQEKSALGVKTVIGFLESKGYKCSKVDYLRTEKGYDVLAEKDNEKLKIEVKCSIKEKGIPDCFNTEFDEDLNLIADFMYIVRIDENHKPQSIQILSKEEFNRYANLHKKKIIIKISNKLKTDLNNKNVGRSISLNESSFS